ncbi:hypothetical protein RN04_14790 [Arthrobacter sp. W1]|nr:hypothetical protein RN04_14790 [Arthrobacter sp. W1]
MRYPSHDIYELCVAAAKNAGANSEMAKSLSKAIVDAQEQGQDALGIRHFFDYLNAIKAHRIHGQAEPTVEKRTAAVFVADAAHGIPHVAFDRVFDDFARAAKEVGVAVFSQKDSYTCGALGYFTTRLAAAGLVGIMVANSTAHMAVGGSSVAVLGTNPLSFAVPAGEGHPPLSFDQASSQTALVNVREAARRHASIPAGWAVDGNGEPTTDAESALLGALLPFGGYKGGNIALMVELLATMSGASWSLDAGFFDHGPKGPDIGMLVIAMDPDAFEPAYSSRVAAHLEQLRSEYGVRLPGDLRETNKAGTCEVDPEVYARLASQAVS